MSEDDVVYRYENNHAGVVTQLNAHGQVEYLVYPPGSGQLIIKTNETEAIALAQQWWEDYLAELNPAPRP